jgi:hypothetical protein
VIHETIPGSTKRRLADRQTDRRLGNGRWTSQLRQTLLALLLTLQPPVLLLSGGAIALRLVCKRVRLRAVRDGQNAEGIQPAEREGTQAAH